MTSPNLFDRKRLRYNLVRAGESLSKADFLVRHAAEEIGFRLGVVHRSFRRIMVSGFPYRDFDQHLNVGGDARITCLAPHSSPQPDLSQRCVVGDEEFLPFREKSFDLAVSLLSLQFANDLPGALIQIRKALSSEGLFMGVIVGGNTLIELGHAFLEAEAETVDGTSPRVIPMADVRDMGALLQRAGFSMPVADVETLTVTYNHPLALMHDIRAMGGQNVLHARSRKLLRRETLIRLNEIYTERFPANGGRIRATFELIYLSGWTG